MIFIFTSTMQHPDKERVVELQHPDKERVVELTDNSQDFFNKNPFMELLLQQLLFYLLFYVHHLH